MGYGFDALGRHSSRRDWHEGDAHRVWLQMNAESCVGALRSPSREATRGHAAELARGSRVGVLFGDGDSTGRAQCSSFMGASAPTRSEAGVRPLRLHAVRHAFATLALQAGKSVRWVPTNWATPIPRSRRASTPTPFRRRVATSHLPTSGRG